MGSTDTMKLMGDAFVELAEQRPLEKISVSDIVAASGKNRKTFYYHFEGKSHLIRWVFRSDLAHMLQNRFEGARLVYEEDREGPMAELPYYAFKKVGIRSLDGSDFLRTLSDTFQNRRSYYAKALRSDEPDGLRAYLHELYTPALANDIRFILSNRSLDEANVRFLAEFYTGPRHLYDEPAQRPVRPRCILRHRALRKHHPRLHRARNQGAAVQTRALKTRHPQLVA